MCEGENIKTYRLGQYELFKHWIEDGEELPYCIWCGKEIKDKTAYHDWDLSKWFCTKCFRMLKRLIITK